MRNSLADVVSAALCVLEAQGLEHCSMRRVAAELGVQPSALYHHVPDKQTLLAHVADEIVRGVPLDASDPRALCVALRAALLGVRDGADVVATTAAFRLGASRVERRLAELVGGHGARTLLLYTFGDAQSAQTRLQAAEFGALLGQGACGACADPALSAEALDAAALDAAGLDASFERGLDLILTGLRMDHGRANQAEPHAR